MKPREIYRVLTIACYNRHKHADTCVRIHIRYTRQTAASLPCAKRAHNDIKTILNILQRDCIVKYTKNNSNARTALFLHAVMTVMCVCIPSFLRPRFRTYYYNRYVFAQTLCVNVETRIATIYPCRSKH